MRDNSCVAIPEIEPHLSVCVLHNEPLYEYFYPSTSSTTSARADSSILEEIQVLWSQSYATEILLYVATYQLPGTWYSVNTAVGNATSCHLTIYDRNDIHIL